MRSHKAGEPAGSIGVFEPGHPDEIWLNMLQARHGSERHSTADWFALIDQYRNLPAHPADPDYVSGA